MMSNYDPEESHDQNFKMLLGENAWDAITFALPKCARHFKHAPEIEPIREETIKAIFSESFLRMDVPVLAKFEKVAFVFLLEHHHDPYSFSIHQVARYVLYLEENYQLTVIPIVYFPNASVKNKTVQRELNSVFLGKRYLHFTYAPVFLKDLPAEKYVKSKNFVARMLLPFMRYAEDDWMKVLDGGIEGVLEMIAEIEVQRRGKYLDFLLHYFNLGVEKWEAYRTHKQRHQKSEVTDMINTILKQEGLKEGQVSESRNLLLMLLPKRLGPMPSRLEQSLRGMTDLERMHLVLASLLELQSWQEVETLLAGNGKNV
jgi:hypothetical protein